MSSAAPLAPVGTVHSFCTSWKGPPIVLMIGERNKCYEQILLALFVLLDYLKCLSFRFYFVNVNNPKCINLCPKERPGCFFFQGLSLHFCHWGPLATSLKKRITFFQCSSRVFQITYLVNCRRALPELNSYEWYPSSEKERKFRHRSFTPSIKLQIIKCHVVIVQERQGNVPKSMLHVQSCFCLIKTIAFLPQTWLSLNLPIRSPKIHSTKHLHLPSSPRNNREL